MMRLWAGAALALVLGGAAAAQVPETDVARCERLAAKGVIAEADRGPAAEACGRAWAAHPDRPELRYYQGRALSQAERHAEALAATNEAAARGVSRAVRALGVMHLNGWGVTADPAKAAGLFQQALDAGVLEAAIDLGWLHQQGEGARKDPAKAAALYQRALDGGELGAAATLGHMHETGEGVPKDLAKAAQLYRRAAAAGEAYGEFKLGWLHETGQGVPKNMAEAVRLYRSAAAKGEPAAQFNLAVLNAEGRGVPKNLPEAVRLYRLSAEGGDARAMYNLALALQAGEGAPRDLAEAERWFRKGVEAGDPVDSPNSLAYLLARQDRDLDEAATLAEAALKAAPDSAPVQDTLALVRLKQGRLTEAATLMRRAVKADDRALYRVRLGDIYARMGLRAEAEAQWRAALAARPGRWVDDELKPEDVRRRLAPPAATTR